LPGDRAAAPIPPHPHVYVNLRSARLFRVHWDESVRESLVRVVE
jgi:hypothetical protein